jgi:hypothetical protein
MAPCRIARPCPGVNFSIFETAGDSCPHGEVEGICIAAGVRFSTKLGSAPQISVSSPRPMLIAARPPRRLSDQPPRTAAERSQSQVLVLCPTF